LYLGNGNAVPFGFRDESAAQGHSAWEIKSNRHQSLSIIAWIPRADLVNIAHFEK
jgi:hypothetical protein